MKNKSVRNCRFVHHAKFHGIMTTLNRLFKIEFEKRGGGGATGKEPSKLYTPQKSQLQVHKIHKNKLLCLNEQPLNKSKNFAS